MTTPPDQRSTNPGFRRPTSRVPSERTVTRIVVCVMLLVALLAILGTVYILKGHL